MSKIVQILCFTAVTFLLAAFREPSLSANAGNEKKNLIKGIASYYHDKFNGRKTASGEIFWNDKLSAAHKTLPLGTWVKVRNTKNDSIVILKVNDRLPKTSKRTIDLSKAAARQLNFIREGLAKVEIEILEPIKPDAKTFSLSPQN